MCSKPDWCLVSIEGGESPAVAVCARVESGRRFGEAGWLHSSAPGSTPRVGLPPRERIVEDVGDRFERMAARFTDALSPGQLRRFAAGLGLDTLPLVALRIGRCGAAATFPMCDARGRVIGVRKRLPGGQKFAVKGGRQGLFIPVGAWQADPLWIAEGPTDTAALLQLGFHAIGRPSCDSGVDLIERFVRLRRVQRVVVVADRDGVGRRGAQRLARELAVICDDVRVIDPPRDLKDAREAVLAGAPAREFRDMAAQAEPLWIDIDAARRMR